MTATVPAQEVGALPSGRRRNAVWWACFGAAMVAMQLYVYGSWIAGDNFRAVSTGADPVPDYQKTWAIVLQVAYTATAVLVTAWVVSGCLRQRRRPSTRSCCSAGGRSCGWTPRSSSYGR